MTLHRNLLALALAACASPRRPTPPLPTLPFAADSLREQIVRPGVVRRFIYAASGPWAIHVLDVDLGCYSAVAVKGASGAVGREKTSVLLRNLAKNRDVVGGVNADFFLFAPPGVPSGALITDGRILTGPSENPVFAFTAARVPLITTLNVVGSATVRGEQVKIGAWNRAAPRGLALFDAAWGQTTDSATSAIEVALDNQNPSRVVFIDTLPAGVSIPALGSVLIAGRNAPASARAALLRLRVGDTVRADVSLVPRQPPEVVRRAPSVALPLREAVGGRPVLVRDSIVTSAVDTQSGPAFATSRHPRTAVGISGAGRIPRDYAGRRVLLVVVDGRQSPYSDGMTLRELANLMLALGARDAINLDGGGSTTMVYSDPDSAGALRIANRPSDQQGERPVGNALAIVKSCAGR